MTEDQVDKIYKLLEAFDTAMLITHGDGQRPHARPMAIACVELNCDLWFFTGQTSTKVHEIKSDQDVLIVCQDEHKRYLSLSGKAELIRDQRKVREFWNETYKTWFPKGVDDPDLLLIRVRAESAEYWDTHGTKGISYIFEAAKAYARGVRPQVKEGEQHGKVSLK